MSDPTLDPYAPPKTDVNQAATGVAAAGEVRYFVMSPGSLVLLSTVTVGLFGLYWAYRQWEAVRQSGEKIRPLGRTIFLIFFVHALFRGIQSARHQADLVAGRAQSAMATLYVILAILSNIAARAEGAGAFLVSIAFTVGEAAVLSLAQGDINELTRKTSNEGNRGIGAGGILLIVLGGALLLLAVVGSLGHVVP